MYEYGKYCSKLFGTMHFILYFFISYILGKQDAKEELFVYLCEVQLSVHAKIRHDIEGNRVPQSTSRAPGIHIC